MQIIPVILSGGSGTRLWPLSRKEYPKQYLPLAGDNTMLQETILRLSGLDSLSNPIIVCNADHRFLVAKQCQQIDIKNPTIPTTSNTIATKEISVDKRLTVLHSGHGPRVPCRNVRIEGCIGCEHCTNKSR